MKIDYPTLLQALGPLPRTGEVARYLHVSYAHIYTLIKKGELEAIMSGRILRVILNSLAEYLERQIDKTEHYKKFLARVNNGSAHASPHLPADRRSDLPEGT